MGHSPEMSESGDTSGSWWKTPLLHRVAKLREREDQVFLILALVIGALTGLAVVAFILLTERMGMRLYPVGGAPWRRLLFPVVGSLGIGYLLFRYFPYARGSGVPQTKAALFAREGRITLRTVLGKFFCTSATLASGIPLGREGPSVQVGAGIASVLGRFLGLRPEKVKALLPVGAAAAIAAAFNTPLAAVLFSLEEIVGDLHAPVLGSVVLASATSWVVLRLSCSATTHCLKSRNTNWSTHWNLQSTHYSGLLVDWFQWPSRNFCWACGNVFFASLKKHSGFNL